MPRILLAVLALALAPLLAVQSQASSVGSAPDWAISWNGFRQASAALARVSSSNPEGRKELKADSEAIIEARRAYASEPLATDALFILALNADVRRQELLQASRDLSKRNMLIAISLLELAAADNDVPLVLILIDQLSRLEPGLSSQFVKPLSESLDDERSIPLIKQFLRGDPAWATSFWRNVPTEQPALNRFIALRSSIVPASDPQSDQNLLATLVAAERYTDAFQLHRSFRNAPNGENEIKAVRYPPIDWKFAKSRDAQAGLDSAGSVDIFVELNSSGELARKLIELTPGKYTLSPDVVINQGTGEFRAKLTCASRGKADRWPNHVIGSDTVWEISNASCRYFWLVIEGTAWESSLPLRASFKELELKKI